jgi:hypothetical protein
LGNRATYAVTLKGQTEPHRRGNSYTGGGKEERRGGGGKDRRELAVTSLGQESTKEARQES